MKNFGLKLIWVQKPKRTPENRNSTNCFSEATTTLHWTVAVLTELLKSIFFIVKLA
jgi:hypothetical protein